MQFQDYAQEYATKTDEEISRLALAQSDLTLEAQLALTAELNARGLKTEQIETFRTEESAREQEQAKDIGQLWFLHAYGVGRKRFGKDGYTRVPDSNREQFTTTLFIVILWLPLIPIGTYRVERERGILRGGQITVLEKLPLDWEQVLKIWAIASVSLLGLIWAFKLLAYLYILRH